VNIDGLWLADFSTHLGAGNGVVVLSNMTLLGGDSNYYYRGTYSLEGTYFRALLTIFHYAGPLNNVFGPLRQLEIQVEGSVGADLIMAHGISRYSPQTRATFRLRRPTRP
jgi:hypothetical protein